MFQVAPIPINLDDLDALIADLSPEEVEELGSVDPDVSTLCVIPSVVMFCYAFMTCSTSCWAASFLTGTSQGKQNITAEGMTQTVYIGLDF